jgi:hypothetical protein
MPTLSSLPLRQRPGDWFFVAIFVLFASSSFLSDLVTGLGFIGADHWLAQANRWYAEGTDPLFLSHPYFLRIQTLISGLVFGPFYLVLVYAFVRGRDWVRIPALLYVSAMTYGMVVYFWNELAGPLPPTNLPKFWAFNLPYLVVPLLLGYRLRRPQPFSAT